MKNFEIASTLNVYNISDDEKWFFKNANVKKRNLLRALLYDDNTNVRKSTLRLRQICTVKEIIVVENIININKTLENKSEIESITQNLFPINPVIHNYYPPLDPLDLKRTLGLVSGYAYQNKDILELFIENISNINSCILQGDFSRCDIYIKEIIDKCGYSSALIRKIILINELTNQSEINIDLYIHDFVQQHNADGINIFLSSLQQCYQPEVDYFSLKKSLMRYTLVDSYLSSMIRFTHNHRPNKMELLKNLHYSLSSSLIDALIYIKLNEDLYNVDSLNGIKWFIDTSNLHQLNLDDVSKFYLEYYSKDKELDEIENIFFKQSSAWFDVDGIKPYRLLLDFFNDSPDSSYLDFDDKLMLSALDSYVEDNELINLVSEKGIITKENKHPNFIKLISKGYATKSAIFNYKVFTSHETWMPSTRHLFLIMERTSDLPRTIDSEKINTMANNSIDIESQIIYYILISKKTQNDEHGFLLRKMIQRITIDRFEKNLISLLDFFHEISSTVALYTYEVLSEDCLALMPLLIDSAHMITEVRADLHDWRGQHSTTEDKNSYFKMAKALRIEHQISKIRNKIDDNRIYVDITRFNEWLFNEAYRDLNNAIMVLAYQNLSKFESPQLLDFINIIYSEFCTNSVFGITSYLGRRIRHGTFKGHAFSSVNSYFEGEFPFLKNSGFSKTWTNWKSIYEKKIDSIIMEKLHIESDDKKHGLIKPTIYDNSSKEKVAKNCIETLIKDYEINEGNGCISIVDEYCWNLITINLREINIFFQKEKQEVIDLAKFHLLEEAESFISENNIETNKPFSLDFHRNINDRYRKINDWFQRPSSVAPQVLLSLLYTVVVKQVKETYKDFRCDEEILITNDIDLMGSSFLCIYDALYVVIYNAAKHGNKNSDLSSQISYNPVDKLIKFNINSRINDFDNEIDINNRLQISSDEDIENAQLIENNSGIKKLYNLDRYDDYFTLNQIECYDRKVHASFTYRIKTNV